MNLLEAFTQDDLIAALGVETVAKGLGYVSRVSALSAEGDTVSALVKGRQRTPYTVEAEVEEESGLADGASILTSSCTCPMGFGCKHVAAMMLVWLHQRRRPDRPREQVLAWVKGFREAAGKQGVQVVCCRRSTCARGRTSRSSSPTTTRRSLRTSGPPPRSS